MFVTMCLRSLRLIWRPAPTAAVCKSWNVSDKYTWDNIGDLTDNYPRTTLSVRIIGAIKRQFFHIVMHVFDNAISHKRFL